MKLGDRKEEYAASIAVIGKAGRFPGAGTLNQFWQNLCAGKESISFFTDEELLSAGVDPQFLRLPNYVKALGFLDDADLFDAQFFGFTPHEARLIDPQHRVFLECAWEALEDAGYASDDPGMIGVYASSSLSTYMKNLWFNPEILNSSDTLQLLTGNDKDHVAMRVSYKLNLKGPSVCVQSACSSSLLAVHMACRSLLTYECDLALAGGVSVGVPLKYGYLYQEGGTTSPDGHCRAFDAKANGTVAGHGAGVVVLKRLFEAIEDGDSIQAIIRGSAVNNDGSNKVGYTAPSVDSQADVIRSALAVARVSSETVSYVEAHGTGTLLGDPIELTALSKAFRSGANRKSRCAIGSLKTNIGHLDAAAGIAGLVKAVLVLEHKVLPPSLNFESPNPKAGFETSPFYVNTSLNAWTSEGTPRRAGVSSLGMGGTNVHLILEEAPDLDREASDRTQHLLVFSAKSEAALDSLISRMADHLQTHSDLRLPDVAHSLQVGRKAFPYRRAVVCESVLEAAQKLSQPDAEGILNGRAELRNRPVVFMFPGQGAQYPGMGAGLYRTERVFREHADRCLDLLRTRFRMDLRPILYPDRPFTEADALQLSQTHITQPALFITEYALAKLWMHWGIVPEAMIGHSIGEYVAACLSGVMSLEDALGIVAKRGVLMQQTQPGTMLAVSCSAKQVETFINGSLSVAAVNTPLSCVVAGDSAKIAALEAGLAKENISCQRLVTSHAFHSEMMDPILEQFRSEVAKIKLEKPKIRYISNLTGGWVTDEIATNPQSWARHLRSTVRFADGLTELVASTDRVFLEVGPGRSLSSFVRLCCQDKPAPIVITSLIRQKPHDLENRLLLESLGRLWTAGVRVDWRSQYANTEARRISLPTYPFERQRYFVEPTASSQPQMILVAPQKREIADWFYTPTWKQVVTFKPQAQQKSPASWMIFSSGGELEAHFVAELRAASHDVTVVQAGPESSAFEKLAAHEFRIDPANARHYKKLLAAFQGSHPDNLVHFWSLTPDKSESAVSVTRAFHSLFLLTQTVGEESTTEQKYIWIVSNGLAEINQDALLNPDKAMLLGPCRTIPVEYPNLHCGLIDVGSPGDVNAKKLLRFCTDAPQSSFTAYRMGRFWSQLLEPLPLPPSVEVSSLREGGVYFITGGLGRTGSTLALHLASKVKAKLVLLDSAMPPARSDWDQLLKTESTPAAARLQVNILSSLEELQTPYLIVQADVCEESHVRKIVAQAIERFGVIHGVIHAAAMPGGGIMQFKTPEEIEAAIAPKVKGTRVLERIFKEIDLDFFAACSSITSVQGAFAHVDSCSANSFLDAFCLNNSFRPSTRTLAIGWDVWKDEVAKPGMGLSSTEAAEVFDRILNLDASRLHVLVSTLDVTLVSQRDNAKMQELEGRTSTATPSLHSRPQLSSTYTAPSNDIERKVAEVWQSVLGIESLGSHDDFWELGGHSLLATQVVSRLKERFQAPLPLRVLFEMPTIEKLAEEIVRLQAQMSPAPSQGVEISELQSAPMRRVDRSGKLALSYGQERLWFINQLETENTAYNMPAAVRIQGPLDLDAMERTLREIVRRHESLRTRFVSVNGEPQQVIDPDIPVALPITDLTHLAGSEGEAEAKRLALAEARQAFDLARGPLFRANVLRLGNQDHVLVFSMHHIVSDQWSVGVLVREVSAIYNSFSAGKPSPLPELEIQYADFSAWQRELLRGPVLEQQLEYWKGKLAGVEPLMLPTDRPRTAMPRPDGAITRFTVPLELTEAVRTLSRKHSATLYMTLLAAFQALLCRYSRQYDITVGSPIAGRQRTETEGLIGFLINTLVLRTDLSGEPDAIDLLQQVKQTTLEAYAHQDVPFEKLVEVLLPQRDLTRSPLFQVLFVLQNVPWSGLQLGAAKMLPFDISNGAAQFEISLVLVETASGMDGFIEYNTGLFEAATITRMIGHYILLLNGMQSTPEAPIHSLEMLGTEERRLLLHDFNPKVVSVPENTIVQLFEEQVQRTPTTTALQFEEDSLSYTELNQRANQLAHYLKQMGVGPEVAVGLCVERGITMVIAMLGVLKAGGAYLPLDARYPAERLKWMLEDMQPPVLLTQSSIETQLPPFTGKIVRLDTQWEEINTNDGGNLPSEVKGENLAYTIYTSGSTGKPKAVGITHSSAGVFVHWARQEFSQEELSGVLASTSICFDLSVYEIFVPLSCGGKVIVAENALELTTMAGREQVTLVNTVPSAMQELVRGQGVPQSVVTVNLAGEALTANLVRQVYGIESIKRVLNLYGPSEDTTYSTYAWIRRKEAEGEERATVKIGKPIDNTQVYVVDEQMEPVPAGVAGELHIGGAGLARGYLKRPDLTADRFLPDPFTNQDTASGGRLYRTGDLVRWQADGNLEYLGRLDQQIKLRGFRIELGEIEAALLEHNRVRQAVVIAREDVIGDKRLVAYLVPDPDSGDSSTNGNQRAELRITGLREYLLSRLPEYMVPGAYVQLQELPLNQNGKIDRKNLPRPDADVPEQEYVAPRNPTEENLCRLWQEVLGRERVGMNDNFFKIGGHSLMAAQLATRMRESFKVDLPLRRMFEAPTIAQLAVVIDQAAQIAGGNGAPSAPLPVVKRLTRKAAALPADRD